MLSLINKIVWSQLPSNISAVPVMFMANGGIMPSLKNPEGYASIAGISFQGHTELVI